MYIHIAVRCTDINEKTAESSEISLSPLFFSIWNSMLAKKASYLNVSLYRCYIPSGTLHTCFKCVLTFQFDMNGVHTLLILPLSLPSTSTCHLSCM